MLLRQCCAPTRQLGRERHVHSSEPGSWSSWKMSGGSVCIRAVDLHGTRSMIVFSGEGERVLMTDSSRCWWSESCVTQLAHLHFPTSSLRGIKMFGGEIRSHPIRYIEATNCPLLVLLLTGPWRPARPCTARGTRAGSQRLGGSRASPRAGSGGRCGQSTAS